MGITFLVPSLFFLRFFDFQYVSAVSSIDPSKPLLNRQILSSPGEIFELGFFSPDGSSNLYLGIWYKRFHPRTVVWVANREKPVTDRTASLTIRTDGNLFLLDSEDNVFWSSNATHPSNSSTAELLDSGNFVLKEGTSGDIFWESFNHPGNTMLPNSSLIYNRKTGERQGLTSWKSYTDPSPGDYVFGIAPHVPPQIFLWKGSRPHWRSGPWSKTKFAGMPHMDSSYLNYISVDDDFKTGILSYKYYSLSSLILTNFLLLPNGSIKAVANKGNGWYVQGEAPNGTCDVYGVCGPFGVCTVSKDESPFCDCLKGYEPKSRLEWKNGNRTGGCMRKAKLLCEKDESTTMRSSSKEADRFYQITGIKLPDFHELVNNVDENGCREECLSNCSCSAYAHVTGGIGCLVWTNPLVDIAKFPKGGENLFIRLSHTEFGNAELTWKLIASLIGVSSFIALVALTFAICRWRHNQADASRNMDQKNTSDMLHFDYRAILAATDNFSLANKLGQGGFGTVYKGMLKDGREIAVKRLSSSSGQGVEEFKNEIMLISKLQHRNLVRLLGYCMEKEERLLIYENMVNKSLDGFLFDPARKLVLDWPKRFNIIQGIARGLLYLHRDSCLRVIHRDLKVSNILLDEKMNPKISDFGLARIFEATQDLVNTHRVVGTLGYMSPEYALGGIFSEKSDVFSFGILLLEIVSGQKTSSFSYDDGDRTLGLLCYAWRSWCKSKGITLVDQALDGSYSPFEVMRCLNIALLCVQDHAIDRPTMSWVVFMLNGETELPEPKQPTFTFQKAMNHEGAEPYISYSLDDVTESLDMGR